MSKRGKYVQHKAAEGGSEKAAGCVVVGENGGDESHSRKELAIHTACSADTTRCRISENVPREFENVSISYNILM